MHVDGPTCRGDQCHQQRIDQKRTINLRCSIANIVSSTHYSSTAANNAQAISFHSTLPVVPTPASA